MEKKNENNSSIISIGSSGLVRVGNSIDITNKIIKEHEERSLSENFKTVKIGDQEWMIKNLRNNCYANGDPIPMITDHSEWKNLKSGAYCNYKNRVENNNNCGYLYNWFAINDSRSLAPKGFRIPSRYDWETLITSLSNLEREEKDRLSSIFFHSKCAMRFWYGFWEPEFRTNTKEIHGNWWSKSEYEFETVGAYYIYEDSIRILKVAPYEKRGGLCVRCIKE
jgi:uncharacterized protein (TIGR02145 family)